ncbi:MAG: M23 family metallopeptidase [Saprospiraceae bacterium]
MTKKLCSCLFFSFVSAFGLFAQNTDSTGVLPAITEFHQLYQELRDGLADTMKARTKVRQLLSDISDYYFLNAGREPFDTTFYFPVQGYGIKMLGGTNGSDYVPGKYNFYNTFGNRSHPAHDIFVVDKDQDMIDDKRNQPIKIYSVSGGIVVSAEKCWDTTMVTKGGNYIYIYEPHSKVMYYYAHNRALFVDLGQIVEPGQTIAFMGRSGLNANKKRSPTHLHFSTLQFTEDGTAFPLNGYKNLKAAKIKYD